MHTCMFIPMVCQMMIITFNPRQNSLFFVFPGRCLRSLLVSLVPRPEEEGEKGPAWFQPFAHALNYLEFDYVLISGGVPMTPSQSHG